MADSTFRSVFDRTFDVAVFGSGYAAFAAVMQLKAQGAGDVALISRRPDLLWETGRAFETEAGDLPADASAEAKKAWAAFTENLAGRNAFKDGQIDGAIAEVLATAQLADSGAAVLYYATPVAVEREGDAVAAVTIASKSGLDRVIARRWVDASDEALLASLLDGDASPRQPQSLRFRAFYQHHAWPESLGDIHTVGQLNADATARSRSGLTGDATLTLQRSKLWPTQRALTIDMPGSVTRPRRLMPAALAQFKAAQPEIMSESVLSHCSLVAYPVYSQSTGDAPLTDSTPSNVYIASPGYITQALATPADRFALGSAAATAGAALTAHEASPSLRKAAIAEPAPIDTIEADICVAGAGTGGAVAAIAAGRAGQGNAKVFCIDPLDFPGGIGSGGGIHWYYFGVTGGLQQELDKRIKAATPLFGTIKQCHGFHPEAKKVVLEDMLDEEGVVFRPGATLFNVTTDNGRVTSASIAVAGGVIRVNAKQWIDSTGDGDLAAKAGAPFRFGREGDGLLHAYSQSSGALKQEGNDPVWMRVVNYDAGWVDPTDVEDFTRGRLVGIRQYLRDNYENTSRPTYIAPAIGLRQGRQIDTEEIITLADLIERRQFASAIGYTGSHYDNHTVEYEFESDEGMFWVWHCEQWRPGQTACDMPYGMLVPKGVKNVWVACRAAGVSNDAHHSVRMQRDMQRLGEAAGYAAVLANRDSADAMAIDMDALKQKLEATGALKKGAEDPETTYGPMSQADRWSDAIATQKLDEALAKLRDGKADAGLWLLYRSRDRVEADVQAIAQTGGTDASFLAAGIGAMWGQPWAQPRLVAAVANMEDGYENREEGERPANNPTHVPRWWSAMGLLRNCGSATCLDAIASVFADDKPDWPMHARTVAALTLERLIKRGVELDRDAVLAIVNRLEADTDKVPGRVVIPRRTMGRDFPGGPGSSAGPTREDRLWQLHLLTARVRIALGLEPQPEAEQFLHDERSLVRRQFANVLNRVPGEPVSA